MINDEVGQHPCLIEAESTQIDPTEFAKAYLANIEDVIDEEVEEMGGSRAITKKSYFADRHIELLSAVFRQHPRQIVNTRRLLKLEPAGLAAQTAKRIVSYCIGVVAGRWDVRFIVGDSAVPRLPGPLDVMPVCPPGMLVGSNALPSNQALDTYPLRIQWDGLLVDDSDHASDIVRRVREVLELIWKDRADAIEKEVCEILGVKELRDYFRKPGKGGF